MRPTRRTRWLGVLLVASMSFLSACTDDSPAKSSASEDVMGHVHGLGVDPESGVLYAGSHLGLFALEEGEAPRRVGEAWHDFMGFLVLGPGHFVASGHPDLTSDLPTHLGLIESTDGGETWAEASLSGAADFHAIDGTQNHLLAYNGLTEQLMLTSDRKNWATVDQRPILDVATSADASDFMATTPAGELLHYPQGDASQARAITAAPPLAFVDWPDQSLLVGLDGDGAVHVSPDSGETWRQVGKLPGPPEALEVTPQGWYAASNGQVLKSIDEGTTWSVIG